MHIHNEFFTLDLELEDLDGEEYIKIRLSIDPFFAMALVGVGMVICGLLSGLARQ